MADLAASDVTITVQERGAPMNRKHRNLIKITFGNGTLTYPAGGVPLPAASKFGMQRQLDYLNIIDQDDASGIVWKYDKENKKLRGWIQGAVISAAGAGTIDDYALDGTSDPMAAAARQPGAGVVALGLVNTTAAGTVFLGKLKELQSAGHAPAAQTLYAEAVGW